MPLAHYGQQSPSTPLLNVPCHQPGKQYFLQQCWQQMNHVSHQGILGWVPDATN
jgi:hypothetical protein